MIKVTIPRMRRMFIDDALTKLPKKGGIYLYYGTEHKELLYVGKAQNLRSRARQHLVSSKWFRGVRHNFKWVDYFLEDCPVKRDIYETYIINTLKPSLNLDKVFTYDSDRWDDKYKSEKQKLYERELQKELDKVYFALNL